MDMPTEKVNDSKTSVDGVSESIEWLKHQLEQSNQRNAATQEQLNQQIAAAQEQSNQRIAALESEVNRLRAELGNIRRRENCSGCTRSTAGMPKICLACMNQRMQNHEDRIIEAIRNTPKIDADNRNV